jgi:kynureninase
LIPQFRKDRVFALELDKLDPLAPFKDQFVIGDPDLVYMDGNSLGRLPLAVADRVNSIVMKEWGTNLINSWNEGWWDAPKRVGEKIAKIIGAAPGQTIVCDAVSVNLFKLVISALSMRSGRSKIITDKLNFPSDLYILQGCVNSLGNKHKITYIESLDNDITPNLEALYQSIDQDTAIVTLSHVAFKSGYLYDMAEITRKAHQVGALVIWDLCHSVGVVPIELDACKVDFALGCTYKYLNGGPGSPAFIYTNKSLHKISTSPIWGWWGQKTPFSFKLNHIPADGMEKYLVGTQPMISMLCLEAALDQYSQADMIAFRKKSIQMGEYFIFLSDLKLAPLGFILGSPRNSSERGSHVSIRHPEGYRINRVLIDETKVIPDFRDPDNIRFGLSPLYTSYLDIWEAIERTSIVVAEKRYEKVIQTRPEVT